MIKVNNNATNRKKEIHKQADKYMPYDDKGKFSETHELGNLCCVEIIKIWT